MAIAALVLRHQAISSNNANCIGPVSYKNITSVRSNIRKQNYILKKKYPVIWGLMCTLPGNLTLLSSHCKWGTWWWNWCVPNLQHSLRNDRVPTGIILYMHPSNERRHYNVMSSHWLGAYTKWSRVAVISLSNIHQATQPFATQPFGWYDNFCYQCWFTFIIWIEGTLGGTI